MTILQKATWCYGAFIGLVIVAADAGAARPIFRAVQQSGGGDKFFHFLLFGVLTFLVGCSVEGQRPGLYGLLPTSVAILVFVVAEEASQLLLSTRSADLGDLAADLVGILLCDLLARRFVLQSEG